MNLPALYENREQLRPDDGNDPSRLDLGKQFVPKFFGFVHRSLDWFWSLPKPPTFDRSRVSGQPIGLRGYRFLRQ